jgi:protein-disulfide isomerase
MSKDFFDMSSKQSMVMGLAIGNISFGSGDKGGNLAAAPTQPTQPTAAGEQPAGKPPAVTNSDHIRGNANAKVTLIEYSDFECPFCSRLKPTVDQILSEYDGDVRLVYRHFPLTSIHPNAQKAAEASECAGEQGKFWEYHDILFANQTALTIPSLKTYAGQLSLKQAQFDSCLDGGKFASKVSQQASDAQSVGITGTPGTFVNDQLVRGAFPYATFQQIIDGYLQ